MVATSVLVGLILRREPANATGSKLGSIWRMCPTPGVKRRLMHNLFGKGTTVHVAE
jgi:hypothetical protein